MLALGEIVATQGVLKIRPPMRDGEIESLICRHACGDWGDLDNADKRRNDQAVRDGGRILSAYKTQGGRDVWIITEADRSVTTVLLPSEY